MSYGQFCTELERALGGCATVKRRELAVRQVGSMSSTLQMGVMVSVMSHCDVSTVKDLA